MQLLTGVDMKNSLRHLTQSELADRWNKSIHTIERYRCDGVGPTYLKIGGKVMYRLEDIEQYEMTRLFTATNGAPKDDIPKESMTLSDAMAHIQTRPMRRS